MEDITVMKLMEEIMEFDQEIKMKKRWIDTRMKMLHNILPKQKDKQTRIMIEKFMKHIEQSKESSKKALTEAERAIPLGMDSGEAIPLGQADVYDQPIKMMAQHEDEEESK